ncbi:PstS family phosphate ABC transporter substrate-binding protein [Virgibacillus ndiopensis]|uniref:PstS family phosphate ABC transporter substrate-binding protein n=1 Tax=Virgibacillus ndiopensis TaxID=2004408 RepID=UPI000C08138E|nr:PstS family phosphate ABC transporter substrate-binding protein [Virgibacillus ndiopensis]
MKLVGSLFMAVSIGIVGLIATIFALFSREADFYVPFFLGITIGLIILGILAIYGQFYKKKVRVSAITFVAVAVVSCFSYEGYQMYINSLEVVSTQDVDLTQYRPFVENTKVVSLNDESTFTINDQLPKLDGATALYPVYAAFGRAVYPEKDYPLEDKNSEILSSQTSNAFDRLIRGEVDIVFMAHPSEVQMNSAEQMGVELTLTPIGREAFVFFVNKDNPVEKLTINQIQKIYSGEITNWREVGGNDEVIRAFQRPEGSGSQSSLISFMDGIPLMEPPNEEIVSGMGGIITEISEYKNRSNAIGFSFRYFSHEMVKNGKIKNIAVEGVLPTKETIQNNSYPIVAEFYAVTANSSNPHVKEFIEWMQSDQGQQIVEKTGYVSVK